MRILILRVLQAFFAFAVTLNGGVGIAAQQTNRLVKFEDLDGVGANKGAMGATLDVSADGRWLAVEQNYRLWVLDMMTGRVLRELGEGLLPIWSPNHNLLAFYSDRSGARQLWTWNPDTDKFERLTNFPDGVDPDPSARIAQPCTESFRYSWSPDSTQIVFGSRVGFQDAQPISEDTPQVLTNSTPPGWAYSGVFAQPWIDGITECKDGRTFGYKRARKGEVLFNQLFVVDARTGDLKQITSGLRSYFHPVWSPDGQAIAFSAAGVGACAMDATCGDDIHGAKGGEIISLDMVAHQPKVLSTGRSLKHRPRWSPNGTMIAYLDSATLFADEQEIHVIRHSDGKDQRRLQSHLKILDFDWDQASGLDRFIVFRLGVGQPSMLIRVSPGSNSTSAPSIVRLAETGYSPWSYARRDGLVAWIKNSQIWILRSGAKKPVKFLDLDPTINTKESKLDRPEIVRWRNGRGEDLEGRLLYPVDYESGRTYPLIVDAYPLGGGEQWMHPMEGNRTWASAGYAVFKPMPRSPHVWMNCTRSREFCAASKGPGAWDVMVDDVMSGVNELKRRGIIDVERMCLYGHSSGASTVNYLVTRTNQFKCAVSVASAMSDWVARAFVVSQDWATTLTGAAPWEDPQAYLQLSAVFRINKVDTPMLLAVGDRDVGFQLDTIRMYNALRQAGKEVTFLRYPNQGHLFIGAGMRDFWGRQMAFFNKYLSAQRSTDSTRSLTSTQDVETEVGADEMTQ